MKKFSLNRYPYSLPKVSLKYPYVWRKNCCHWITGCLLLNYMLRAGLHLLELNISWQYDVGASDRKAVQEMKNSIRDLQRICILIVDWDISISLSEWKKANCLRSWKDMFPGKRETCSVGNLLILQAFFVVLLFLFYLLRFLDSSRWRENLVFQRFISGT